MAQTELDALAQRFVPCPRCEALPTQSCRTVTGAVTHVHSYRTEAVYTAYTLGYEHGRHDFAPVATPVDGDSDD